MEQSYYVTNALNSTKILTKQAHLFNVLWNTSINVTMIRMMMHLWKIMNSEIYEEGVDSDDDVSKSNDEEGDSNIYYDCNDFDNDDRRKDGLLCLAEQKKRHGPIRWYWEGTSERFIQQLKKVLVAMRRTPI